MSVPIDACEVMSETWALAVTCRRSCAELSGERMYRLNDKYVCEQPANGLWALGADYAGFSVPLAVVLHGSLDRE